jgi:uncharacterized membrane protein
MRLLLVYILLVAIGEVAAVEVGLLLAPIAPALSMPTSLVLIFGTLGVAWLVAIRLDAMLDRRFG